MEKLSSDLVLRVLLFLRPSEVTWMLSVDTRFSQVTQDEYLWRNLCTLSGTPSLHKSLFDEHSNSYVSCRAYQLLARRLQACSEIRKVKWLKLQYPDQNPGPILEKMEAHTATTFLNRFVVVIGGWCRANDNSVHVIDASVLGPASDSASSSGGSADTHHPLVTLTTFTENTPTFRYGFSATEYQGRLLVLGGCQGGGYSHDCNNAYCVDMRFDRVDENGQKQSFYPNKQSGLFARELNNQNHSVNPRQESQLSDPLADCATIRSHPPGTKYEVVARYTNNLTPHGTTALPISRGYHTAVLVRLDGRECLLVWGGLHRRAPTTQLELCELSHSHATIAARHAPSNASHSTPTPTAPSSLLWRAGHAQGAEPSPRFGHTCVALSADDWQSQEKAGGQNDVLVDRLVFTGGSNGNDLVRNGREIREIHILNIVRCNHANSSAGGGDVLVWSTPRLSFVPAGLRPARVIPGRCHSAVQVGKRILFFGGGAACTNTVSALRIPPPPTLAVVPRESSSVPFRSVDQKMQQMVDELLRADVVRREEDTDTVEPASPIGQEGFAVCLPDVASAFNVATSRPVFPRPRLSAAAALVGRHWVVVGGFSVDHNQMGDVWALDLAYATSDACRADKEAKRQHFGSDAEEEGEEEGEEEEEDYESSEDESEVAEDDAPMGLLAFIQQLLSGGGGTAPAPGVGAAAQDLQHTHIVAQLMHQGEDDAEEDSDLNQSSSAGDGDESAGAGEGESEEDDMETENF